MPRPPKSSDDMSCLPPTTTLQLKPSGLSYQYSPCNTLAAITDTDMAPRIDCRETSCRQSTSKQSGILESGRTNVGSITALLVSSTCKPVWLDPGVDDLSVLVFCEEIRFTVYGNKAWSLAFLKSYCREDAEALLPEVQPRNYPQL